MKLLDAFIEVSIKGGLGRIRAQIADITRLVRNIPNINLATGNRPLPTFPSTGGFFSGLISNAGVFASVLKLVSGGIQNLIRQLIKFAAQKAFQAAAFGLKLILGPIKSVFNFLRNIVRFAPRLALLFGGLALRNLVSYRQQLDRIRLLFTQAFGSSASSELNAIRAIATRLGVNFDQLAESYGRFAAATSSTLGLSEQKTLFEGVATASAALSLEAHKVQSIFIALEQIASKGRISMEELRRQLGNALPGAFAIVSRALGVTSQELEKLIAAGSISPKKLLSALGPQLIKEFSDGATRASRKVTAAINRLTNNFNVFRAQLADIVAIPTVKFFESLFDVLNKIGALDFVREFASRFAVLANVVRSRIVPAFQGVQRYLAQIQPLLRDVANSFAIRFIAAVPIITAMGAAFARLLDGLAGGTGLINRISKLFTGLFAGLDIDTVNELFAFATTVVEKFDIAVRNINIQLLKVAKTIEKIVAILALQPSKVRELNAEIKALDLEFISNQKKFTNAFKDTLGRVVLESTKSAYKSLFDDTLAFLGNVREFLTGATGVDKISTEADRAKETLSSIQFFDAEALQRQIQNVSLDNESSVAVKTRDNTAATVAAVATGNKKLDAILTALSPAIREFGKPIAGPTIANAAVGVASLIRGQ